MDIIENWSLEELIDTEHPEVILEQTKPFMELMMWYQCALMEVETKLQVLNDEFSLQYNRNPFEAIKSRIKKPLSIIEKMKRKGFPLTLKNLQTCLNDIAGIRVICSFPEDIYTISELLANQDDILVLERKDYIEHPKPNGYRSLHLILDIPIFLSKEKKHMKVEVQFRTIAMDFWASLEHKLKYKQAIPHAEEIARELEQCAQIINALDYRMQDIRNRIENGDPDKYPSELSAAGVNDGNRKGRMEIEYQEISEDR